MIMGKNFGDLLMKKWSGAPMTPAESVAIAQWDAPAVVHFAAFSILCNYEQNGKSRQSLLSDLDRVVI